ncbi:MAG: uroporphyrinogen decarboxylase family protein [Anaerolineaceae bacterium]
MKTKLSQLILDSPTRLAIPIGIYAGLEITGESVKNAVSDAKIQTEAILALHERFQTPVMLTAMDLSAESEAFGCSIRMEEDEIPTVIGRLTSCREEVDALKVPAVGTTRTAVHLQTTTNLVKQLPDVPVLGGVIGPFSLAGRLFGVSEALEISLTDPETLEVLLEKATCFLTEYVKAFRDRGADGVVMAEPAAGLLSPRGLGRFSAPYVKRIADAVQTDTFSIVLHNCGAKIVHLPKILESGARIYHFGAPMDILKALEQVDGSIILGGNLDPTSVFFSGKPDEVRQLTRTLLDQTEKYRNYFISSGCDLPPHVPIQNMEAFYSEVSK